MSLPGWRAQMTEMKIPRHFFITGGVRSGKSKFAENLAGELGGKVIYLATAQALDPEMEERINRHRQHRPNEWTTIEEPLEAVSVIAGFQSGTTVLLDCLTLFLSNLFFKYEDLPADRQEQAIYAQIKDLAKTVKRSSANIIIVSNEIGFGLVPENNIARRFRDIAGNANQTVAAACDEVYLMVSGIPVRIKGGRND